MDQLRETIQPGWHGTQPAEWTGVPGVVPEATRCRDITCSEKDDLVFQCQVREVGYSFGPLDECEELLVSCVTDVGDRVVCLRVISKGKDQKKRGEFVNAKPLIIAVCMTHGVGSS